MIHVECKMPVRKRIALRVFFRDPLESQPHDRDVKALTRIAVVWNIPIACNHSTADFLISSPLMQGQYPRRLPDYSTSLGRQVGAPGSVP